jgi:hypothetical protein
MTVVLERSLRKGISKSCRCLADELTRERNHRRHSKHFNPAVGWHGKHPLNSIWHGIKSRCFNPRATDFENYGGRGITVCESWRNSFESFAIYIENTLGPRPSPQHTIHRIRNHAAYEPGNVKWATPKEQASSGNRRKNPVLKPRPWTYNVGGETLAEACRRAGVPYSSVKDWIHRKGCTPQQAIAHFEERRQSADRRAAEQATPAATPSPSPSVAKYHHHRSN